jgi:hypothetical protein
VVGGAASAWVLRNVLTRVWPAVLGLVLVTTFVVIRAASFHHVETVLNRMSGAGNVALELSDIAIVVAGAGWALRSGRGSAGRRTRPDPPARTSS